MRILNFLSLLATRPADAYGRMEGITDSRLEPLWVRPPSYEISSLELAKSKLKTYEIDLHPYLSEPALDAIQARVQRDLERLPGDAPFRRELNGDFALARLCYAVVRSIRPRRVLETGVCYGVTTAFLLQALAQNGTGKLHSIDLPPLGKDSDGFVGKVVPHDVRNNWTLHLGTSKSVLPGLLTDLHSVDVFVHDSLHTYRNMRRELNLVGSHLSSPAVVISDDIEGNPAFWQWTQEVRPDYSAVLRQEAKTSLLGISVFAKTRVTAETLRGTAVLSI